MTATTTKPQSTHPRYIVTEDNRRLYRARALDSTRGVGYHYQTRGLGVNYYLSLTVAGDYILRDEDGTFVSRFASSSTRPMDLRPVNAPDDGSCAQWQATLPVSAGEIARFA